MADMSSYPSSSSAADNVADGSMGDGDPGYISWTKADDLLSHRTLAVPGAGSDMHTRIPSTVDEVRIIIQKHTDSMSSYSLEARIIQKKDQLEEISSTGVAIPTPIVDEVRTGQQFLIKLHLSRNRLEHTSTRFPSLRVGRREAINTAGEPKAEAEPLTLEIAVHLAKSGQIRKGACAKCCHKYGPSSPILVLLDQLSPSVTDPATYAHIDTTTGSITMLAKVLCSSTDHGERGNKDRYIFEFRLKRTNSIPASAPAPEAVAPEDDGETISTCYTHPIMCSGHHKAKRVYPHLRPTKVTKAGPTPKTKTVKRQNSAPNITLPLPGGNRDQPREFMSAGPLAANNGDFPSAMAFLPNDLSQAPLMGSYGDRSNSGDSSVGGNNSAQPFMAIGQASSEMMHQQQSQYPRVTEVRPNHGPIRKKTDVILRGTFFREGMVPYFGCFPAHDIIVETANMIVCKTPESPLPGTVPISIYDNVGNTFADLGQFTYTDDNETEVLILQLQLRLAHRALEYMHAQATGQRGNATDILRNIPGLATSPRSGSVLMMDNMEGGPTLDTDTPMLSLNQVEEGILETLDHVPRKMDISLQLEDGSNMLHLSILLGFDRLTTRLIEEGCDIETQDMYAMTPLMYAVLKRNETMARLLIIAGASSSGASSPQEFYAHLPRRVEPTLAMCRFLSVSCARFSNAAPAPSGVALDTVDDESEMDGVEKEEGEGSSSSYDSDSNPSLGLVTATSMSPTMGGIPRIRVESTSEPLTLNGYDMMAKLADNIQSIRVHHEMPPLDQQDLPPLQIVGTDGLITVNTEVVKADTAEHGAELYTNVNPESGYHSGIYSEVQERLNRLHLTTLPSEGVQMEAVFKKLTPTTPAPSSARLPSNSSTPPELFRTGDSFAIEVRLWTSSGPGYLAMPIDYLGIRFPHEMVKRTSGKPASILTEMTYVLKTTIELGQLSVSVPTENIDNVSSSSEAQHSHGDGVPLVGSCQPCSRFLHEQKKLSPSRRSTVDPSVYPILQFYIPGGTSSMTSRPSMPVAAQGAAASQISDTSSGSSSNSSPNTNNSGVVQLRDGVCEVKAKVNCSSLHHLLQRERAKRTGGMKHRQAEEQVAGTSTSTSTSASSSSKERKSLALTNLRDPGYVFKFELIHPTEQRVVARYETKPILFQSYSRGRS
ncbi:SPT3 Dosage dependent suppressor of Ty-induced promoter mutations-like protein [Gamsiella multidivaricata]|nr:SPT3 Dosage dependent suppressor of Ty-induced promoter mutations-like protein [Gamsiella multidivaricata]